MSSCLRSFRRGRLQMAIFNWRQYLPQDNGTNFHGIPCEEQLQCSTARDSRVEELTVMHTIWMREHNRVADLLGDRWLCWQQLSISLNRLSAKYCSNIRSVIKVLIQKYIILMTTADPNRIPRTEGYSSNDKTRRLTAIRRMGPTLRLKTTIITFENMIKYYVNY